MSDKNFIVTSNLFAAIEFDEFLDMYRRLFLMSKTSVSDKLSDILPQKVIINLF